MCNVKRAIEAFFLGHHIYIYFCIDNRDIVPGDLEAAGTQRPGTRRPQAERPLAVGRVEEVPAGISGLVWGGWAVVHRPAGPGTAGAGTRLRWWGGSLQRRGRIGGNLQGCGRSGRESGEGVLVAACLNRNV